MLTVIIIIISFRQDANIMKSILNVVFFFSYILYDDSVIIQIH